MRRTRDPKPCSPGSRINLVKPWVAGHVL